MIFLGGYVFDIFGRKFSVYIMLLMGGLIMVFFPIVAPDKNLFILCFTLFGVCVSPLSLTPLVQDYVMKESYGKALAL